MVFLPSQHLDNKVQMWTDSVSYITSEGEDSLDSRMTELAEDTTEDLPSLQ